MQTKKNLLALLMPPKTDLSFSHMQELDSHDVSGASLALHVLGDAWVLRILRSSFRGARRFSDFMRSLNVSRAVLTDRLNRLCKDELLHKVELPNTHPEYRMTERALDLWSVYIAMWKWETQWGTGVNTSAHTHDEPRSRLIHTKCGQVIDPVYQCAQCAAEISAFDTYANGYTNAALSERHVAQQPRSENPARKRYRQSSSDDRATLTTLQRVYGDRWNASLMASAFRGKKTFSELSNATDIWPSALTDRLEELQKIGMLRAHSYAGSRQEYRLTRAAMATFPITLELIRFGDKWFSGQDTQLQIMHRPCMHVLLAQWHCPFCKDHLQRQTIQFE